MTPRTAQTPSQDGITISRSIQWFMFSPSRSGQKPAQVQLEPSEQTGTIPFAGHRSSASSIRRRLFRRVQRPSLVKRLRSASASSRFRGADFFLRGECPFNSYLTFGLKPMREAPTFRPPVLFPKRISSLTNGLFLRFRHS
jgi:hypothetical protein